MADHKRPFAEHEGPMIGTDYPQWSARRIALESAGYVFLAWAALIALNVFAFTDPAARAAATSNLTHVPQILTHLPRNAALVFVLFFTLGAAIAPGDALLRAFRIPARDAFDRIAFGTAAGLVVLTALAYALATLHLLRLEVEIPLLLAGAVASTVSIRRWLREQPLLPDAVRVPRALTIAMWILLGAALYVTLLAALIPEIGFDARYYHLAEAERYAQHGGFYNLLAAERMWPAALPHYHETLYAFAWVLTGAIGAKLIAWGGALAIVLAVVAFARAWFSSTAVGVFAALILLTTPVLAWSATTANNDLAAVPFVLLALHALLVWRGGGSAWALYGAGLIAGMTYGIKPFGAFTVIALGIVVAWTLLSRGTPRAVVAAQLARFAGCALLGLLPALITATWMIGDPIFPLFPGIFPSRYGANAVGEHLSAVIGSRLLAHISPSHILLLPWSMTMDPARYRNLIGPIWLATLPVWLAVPFFSRRFTEVVRPLAVFTVAFTAIVFLSGAEEFRYIATAVTVVALLIGYAVFCLDWRAARALQATVVGAVLVFAVLGNPLVVPLERNSSAPAVMGAEYLNWDYLYGTLPESAIQLQYVPILQYTNSHLDPRTNKIYDGANVQLMNVYSNVELFNGTAYQSPAALNEWSLASPDAFERLRANGCTYVIWPKAQLAQLKAAPVWRHLQFVTEAPSINGPANPDVLLKIVR